MTIYDLVEKIIVDKAQLENLIQKAERLDDYIKKAKIKEYNETLSDDDDNHLTKYQLRAIDYVQKNPGTNKQKVANYFSDKSNGDTLSRAPVWKLLDHLINEGIILNRPDENNSQMHHLSINNDNIIAMKLAEINTFYDSFLRLLHKTKELQEQDRNKKAPQEVDIRLLLVDIMSVYRHVLNSYIMYALFEWPHIISDKKLARKLLNIIISKMIELLFEIHDLFDVWISLVPFCEITNKHIRSPILKGFTRDSFLLDPVRLEHLYQMSRKNNLWKETFYLIKDAWNISFKIYQYYAHYTFSASDIILGSPEGEKLLMNDWRASLLAYRKQREKLGLKFELDKRMFEPMEGLKLV